MTQTTYYEFNKPEGTDLVNPLIDTNPNWDALDADLHEFNERSIANCTEVVALGVHTISRLDTTSKFLKWIATANFTAGDTFTVDGLPVAASTPAGATLATNAYVTGSVVLACLNADNSAMTIYVSGTTVASDAERLGGELPSYYGTATDVSNNATDITNLQNQVGNTSIVGIGDGTCTGAIDSINDDLTLDYSNSSLPVDTDINTFLQGILERMYPISIMRGNWTAGGGASVSRDSDNQLSINTGSGNSPYIDSPSFTATLSTSTLRIVGTVNSGNTWATMNIKALPSNTSIASWNTNNSGRNINITATVPAGTTQIRMEGFHTGSGVDVYTQFNISE